MHIIWHKSLRNRAVTIVIFYDFIVQGLSHANLCPGEVRVVVLALFQLYPSWRIVVPSQQREQVVLQL